ncbi:hypothetical protein [Congregicoccus parvus]|uniref:hypothetical protein n=1 Tax=Congregicoccus parvus TaxID=3081749 RepID=UPI003FA5B717
MTTFAKTALIVLVVLIAIALCGGWSTLPLLPFAIAITLAAIVSSGIAAIASTALGLVLSLVGVLVALVAVVVALPLLVPVVLLALPFVVVLGIVALISAAF